MRRLYDFITGGSIASVAGLACGIAAAVALPAWRAELLVGFVALGFIASTFERVR